MPNNLKREDLRISKTYRALMSAMFTLLGHRNFMQITVNDLCQEALVSRATFYAHFNDKYDLLKYCLSTRKPELINEDGSYVQTEKAVNSFVNKNARLIKNLIENANDETLSLLQEFIFSLLNIKIETTIEGEISPKYLVVSKFCAGGMINLLEWQVKNKFPEDLPMMNIYFYDILLYLMKLFED